MSLPHRKKLSPQEYLDIERRAPYKSEYVNGEMFAMSGASPPHELIKMNVAGQLYMQFRGGPCRVYTSDLRVKVSSTGMYTYPDVVGVCGSPSFEERELDVLLNPTVIMEVLSPTTEGYDRGGKFAHYRNIDSLTDYLLIAQDRVGVDHFTRQADGRWTFIAKATLQEAVDLPEMGVSIPLADIYDRVDLPTDVH